MSFQIDRGLFKYDFSDYHAILGIPVDADVKEVRKRYLKIARRLHPDSCKAASEAEKKQASELLSKLVNPAYEELSTGSREYAVMLNRIGKRLAGESAKVSFSSEVAKQLNQAGANLDHTYKSSIQNLASGQYESLDKVLEAIAEISELNMVYLMQKGGKSEGTSTAKKPLSHSTGTGSSTTATGAQTATGAGAGAGVNTAAGTPPSAEMKPQPEAQSSRVDSYFRRAEGYMAKGNFAKATLELREALSFEPNHGRCHSLLGVAYLKQNQTTMAKVHLQKALQLNPNDEMAMKGKQYLDKLAQKTGGKTSADGKGGNSDSKTTSSDNKSAGKSGGFLGGLFGGKKK
jgi:curved DNA-binding protein CbpA